MILGYALQLWRVYVEAKNSSLTYYVLRKLLNLTINGTWWLTYNSLDLIEIILENIEKNTEDVCVMNFKIEW